MARASTAKSGSSKAAAKAPPKKLQKKTSARTAKKPRVSYKDSSGESPSTEAADDSEDAYSEEAEEEEEEEAEEEEIDSDDLDEDDEPKPKRGGGKKAKSATASKSSSPVKNGVAIKLAKGPAKHEQVADGIVAPYTMKFLADLAQNNEREWLALHDERYRASLANWHAFVTAVVPRFVEADWTMPTLPSKDLVMRIYRDIRFSQDKTPYKTNFSAGLSRTGRKGPWAGYYIQIKPGGNSLIGGGKWAPEKNDLAILRHAILRNPRRIRKVINDPDFVATFGPPKPGEGKRKRQNIFGHDDALKNCPKLDGVTKDHQDIDLLKLRTISAVKMFPDEVVLSDGFVDEVGRVAKVLAPLVQLLNDMILPQSDDEGDEDEEGDDEEEEEG